MKALVLEKVGQLAIRDFPLTEQLGPHDVRIELTVVGVCGSDVHYYEFGRIGHFVVREPMILGHEAAGRVVAIKKSRYEKSLSHSEQMFLAVIRHHFTGVPQEGPPIMMYSLDTKRRNDMLFLLGLLHYMGP